MSTTMHLIRLTASEPPVIAPARSGLTAFGIILCLVIGSGVAAGAGEPEATLATPASPPDSAGTGGVAADEAATTENAPGDSLLAPGSVAPDSLAAAATDRGGAEVAGANQEVSPDSMGQKPEKLFSPPAVPQPRPFGVGESLTFSIQYGPVKAGTAVLAVEGVEQVGDRECYRIVSTTHSNAVFSVFYKVRDRIVSLIDVRHLLARRTAKEISEKDYRLNQVVEWDQAAGSVRYDDGTVLDIEPGSRDILGAMYYVRALPLAVGDSIPVPVHDNKKSYPMMIDVVAAETIDTPLGRFDCWKVEPQLQSAGLFQRSGSLTVWLTRDQERLPVMMQSAIKVGSISAILIELERGNRTMPELGLNAN